MTSPTEQVPAPDEQPDFAAEHAQTVVAAPDDVDSDIDDENGPP